MVGDRPRPAPGSLSVVIVAAGSGTRFGREDKALAALSGEPLLLWSARAFRSVPETGVIIVVLGSHTLEQGRAVVEASGVDGVTVVAGGATRADSTRAGLAALPDDADGLVAIHDAARPLVSREVVERTLDAAREHGAAAPALPVSDTIHVGAAGGDIEATLDRARLWAAQTPQIARRDWLETALRRAGAGMATDEAGALAAAGFPVRLVAGDPRNLKITWPGDLAVAEAMLAELERGEQQ